MFAVISGFIATVAAVAVAGFGYVQTKRFVSKKLRFVDQAQNPFVPLLVGFAAFAIAVPVVAFVPFVGAGTAIVFGIAVGAGTRAGVKSFGRALYP
jgi:hypothetical protein